MTTVLDNLIKLKPKIDLRYRQRCPNCHGFLITNDFYIFGWRNLALGRCDSCQKEYVFDMAVGHGITHPAFIEIGENKVYAKQGADWLNQALKSRGKFMNNRNLTQTIKNLKIND